MQKSIRILIMLSVAYWSFSMSCEEAVEPPVDYEIATSVIPEESGNVILVPQKESYKKGDEVTIIAQADDGFTFSQWSGDLEGSADTQTVTIEADFSVVAEFKALYAVRTATSFKDMDTLRAPYGEVVLQPNQTLYAQGEFVQAVAIPREGFRFVEWKGAVSGSNDTTMLTVNSNASVEAVFAVDCPQEEDNSTECYQILYPNGGETFRPGDTVDVVVCSKNEFCDFSQTGFSISVNNGQDWFDANQAAELDGMVTTWVVPDTLRDVFNSASVYSDQVRLKVEKYNFEQVNDITDGTLTITK